MKRVGIIGDNSVEYINTLIDVWNNGNCAVLVDWRTPVIKATEMLFEAQVSECYIEEKYFQYFFQNCHNKIKFIPYLSKGDFSQTVPLQIYDKFIPNYSCEEAIIIYSSGTTGKAKGIVLSHYAINVNADAIIEYMKPTQNDCIRIVKSLTHSSTLTGELLVALKTRMKLVVGPTIVPPRYVFRNIEEYGVSILCVNPTLLKIYCEWYYHKRSNITSLKKIYVSGSILDDMIYMRAHEIFKDIQIYNVYGLSEAGPRVSAQREECCKSNSVGKAIKSVEIVLVNNDGSISQQGDKGIIHIKTPSQYSYYVSGAVKYNSLYDGWLNTGDIGYIDLYGELHITGRIDDVMIIDSHKIYPQEIEAIIYKYLSVEECVVIQGELKKQAIICCLYRANTPMDHQQIKIVEQYLMPYERPTRYIQVKQIPKLSNGKNDTHSIKDMLNNVLNNSKGEEYV